MSDSKLRRRMALVALMVTTAVSIVGAPSALAQTTTLPPVLDPYTGGTIPGVPGGVEPGLAINVSVAVPGQEVRIQGCLFVPDTFIRITINPGDEDDSGTPCPGAESAASAPQPVDLAGVGGIRQMLEFEPIAQTTTTVRNCPYNNPGKASPPDTTAGGAIASTRAMADGCVDTLVTIPRNLSAGSYELCAVPVGQQSACAVIRIASSSRVAGRGFARTGLMVLPWVLGAVAAVAIGRVLTRRARRTTA